MAQEKQESETTWSKIARRHLALFICLLLLLISRFDMGDAGLAIFLALFSLLIFLELFLIRRTLIDVYAEAITENRFLHIFLKNSAINGFLTGILSIFFAVNLLTFLNLADLKELLILAICGLGLTWLIPSISGVTNPLFKEKPAAMFSRVAAISIFVAFAVILETAYTVTSPVDTRVSEAFDENIPDFVIEDVSHSSLYYQHFLRSLAFLDMNVDSIRLSNEAGYWFDIVRFFLTLSPTPFIAFSLLLLSITSIRRIIIVRGDP